MSTFIDSRWTEKDVSKMEEIIREKLGRDVEINIVRLGFKRNLYMYKKSMGVCGKT